MFLCNSQVKVVNVIQKKKSWASFLYLVEDQSSVFLFAVNYFTCSSFSSFSSSSFSSSCSTLSLSSTWSSGTGSVLGSCSSKIMKILPFLYVSNKPVLSEQRTLNHKKSAQMGFPNLPNTLGCPKLFLSRNTLPCKPW